MTFAFGDLSPDFCNLRINLNLVPITMLVAAYLKQRSVSGVATSRPMFPRYSNPYSTSVVIMLQVMRSPRM